MFFKIHKWFIVNFGWLICDIINMCFCSYFLSQYLVEIKCTYKKRTYIVWSTNIYVWPHLSVKFSQIKFSCDTSLFTGKSENVVNSGYQLELCLVVISWYLLLKHDLNHSITTACVTYEFDHCNTIISIVKRTSLIIKISISNSSSYVLCRL